MEGKAAFPHQTKCHLQQKPSLLPRCCEEDDITQHCTKPFFIPFYFFFNQAIKIISSTTHTNHRNINMRHINYSFAGRFSSLMLNMRAIKFYASSKLQEIVFYCREANIKNNYCYKHTAKYSHAWHTESFYVKHLAQWQQRWQSFAPVSWTV